MMEETRKIKCYKAPFDMKFGDISKGDPFVYDKEFHCYNHLNENGIEVPAEIVEAFFEPEYEESVEEKIKEVLIKHHNTYNGALIEEIKSLFTNNK